ncbi:MAG TPA: ABC transporter permease [Bryobacteraceae bacterium]|jgi:predicted permease
MSLWPRLRNLLSRRRRNRDLEEELQHHTALAEQHLERSGMPPDEAHYAARRDLGNVTRALENSRSVWSFGWIESLFRDARYGLRNIRKAPLFALSVIGTIALVLGLNTTMFTALDAYVLRPLPVRDPYSLYQFVWVTREGRWHKTTLDEFEDLQRRSGVFADALGFQLILPTIDGQTMVTAKVTPNYFSMLGVSTVIGRPLATGDTRVAVLNDTAWTSKFGSDPNILGKKLIILGIPWEIIGVARSGFPGLGALPADLWIPLDANGTETDRRVFVIGRLKDSVTPAQAKAALLVWSQQQTAGQPEAQRAVAVNLDSAATSIAITPTTMAIVLPILVAFGLVLLMACANIASMMLARAAARQREIGVRLSLGAGRGRIIRQLLTESLVLALPAAALAFLVSRGTLRLMQQLLTSTIPPTMARIIRLVEFGPDVRVFLYLMAAALACTLAFGLAPALQATRASLTAATRGEFGGPFRASRLRNALVVGQVSVCVFLLICTAILIRSGNRVRASDVGMTPEGVLDVRARGKIQEQTVAALQSDPAVEGIAAAWQGPFNGPLDALPVNPAGHNQHVWAGYTFVSPEYFSVLHIPLVRGRMFTVQEAASGAPVTIISQATAARLWPGQDPLGESLRLNEDPRLAGRRIPPYTSVRVIGIARDAINGSVSDGIDPTCLYFPTDGRAAGNASLLVRVRGNVEAARRHLDTMLATATPGAVNQIYPLEDMVATQIYPFLVGVWVTGFLAAFAVVLTLSGIYGVLAFLVSQRTKEIGLRIALGATGAGVVRMVLAQSLRLALLGIAIGGVLALGLSRMFDAQIESLKPYDALAYGSGIAVAACAALAAAYFPARRAARVDPASTLRCD